MFALMVAGAAVIVLIPGAPVGLITEAVQAVAGVLLPSASMFLLLLCNDPAVLGPWRNGVKLNVFATIIEAVLILLSLILMATTLFPHLNATLLSEIGGAVLATRSWPGLVIWWNRRHGAGFTMIETEPALPKIGGRSAAGAAVSAPRLHRAKADDVQHGGVPFAGRGHADRHYQRSRSRKSAPERTQRRSDGRSGAAPRASRAAGHMRRGRARRPRALEDRQTLAAVGANRLASVDDRQDVPVERYCLCPLLGRRSTNSEWSDQSDGLGTTLGRSVRCQLPPLAKQLHHRSWADILVQVLVRSLASTLSHWTGVTRPERKQNP